MFWDSFSTLSGVGCAEWTQRILNPGGDEKRMRPTVKRAKTDTTMETTDSQSTG